MMKQRIVLQVTQGLQAGKEIVFTEADSFLVGRGLNADLRLQGDCALSRAHFRLEVNAPQCRLMDLESRNGTLVNGKRAEVVLLNHGDVIRAGETEFQFALDPPPIELSETLDEPPNSQPVSRADDQRLKDSLTSRGYDQLIELGRGGMGVVYRARHVATGQECAVKVALPDLELSDNAKQLFLREASTLSGLRHANIIQFREIGISDGVLFFSMEYVPTVDFNELLKSRTPEKKVRLVCGVARQVLSALNFTHRQGIVHRDIKPANILTERVEGKLRVKVADFGLAKSFENAGFSGLTTEGVMRGTLPFMPPEQIRDSRSAGPSCDMYAVGVSLYRWLSGEYPYEFDTVRKGLNQVLDESVQPVSLGKRSCGLPPELITIVDRSISKQERDRYSSASAMRTALAEFPRRT